MAHRYRPLYLFGFSSPIFPYLSIHQLVASHYRSFWINPSFSAKESFGSGPKFTAECLQITMDQRYLQQFIQSLSAKLVGQPNPHSLALSEGKTLISDMVTKLRKSDSQSFETLVW